MIDTIAAMTTVVLPDNLFQGGRVSEDFETGQVHVRLWLNPRGDVYAPRFTYWRERSVLKAECSLPKLLGRQDNLTSEDVSDALDLLDMWISEAFGSLPSVRGWTCQRVDYVWTFDVDDPSWYIATYGAARIRRMSRHDYRSDGVVWKQGNRWVKLYNKTSESEGDARGLRLEVSNYADAVRYMCSRWFGCERTISELTHFGRALFVLARHVEAIGLDQEPQREATLLRDLSVQYKRSAAEAWYAWTLLQHYGMEAAEMNLISKSALYRWRKKLTTDGFMTVTEDNNNNGDDVVSLPVVEIVEKLRENVGLSAAAEEPHTSQNLAKILGLWSIAPGAVIEREFEEVGAW